MIGQDADRTAASPLSPPSVAAEWRRATVLIALGIAAIIAVYWPVVVAAVTVWYSSTSYNHCFLIPVISGYLLWERRAVFAELAPQPTGLPILAILGLSAVALVGNAMSILEVQQFALVGMMIAFVLTIVGWRVFKAILFPMMYLFFMVPTGEFLVPKLQDFTAAFVVAGLQLVNVPVYLDGVFIRIPNGLFQVAEACAGLRFLIASVAFGFLFAHLMYRNWHKRIVFVVLSFVIPVIANGFRAFGIVMIAHLSDNKLAVGVDHIVYGWGFFVAILLAMMWVGLKFRDADAPGTMSSSATPVQAAMPAYLLFVAGLAAVFASAAGPAYGYWLEHRYPVHAVSLPAIPVAQPWRIGRSTGDPWRPKFPGADGELRQVYVGPGATVQVYVAYYSFQRYGAKIVSAQNRLEDDHTWRRAADGRATAVVDGRTLRINKQILTSSGQERRLAWYFYWVDQELTADPLRAKLLGARGTLLTGHPQAAVIVLAADVSGTDEQTEASLRDLLKAMKVSDFFRQIASR